jgi:hypothetical protein
LFWVVLVLAASELALGIGANIVSDVIPRKWPWMLSPEILWPVLAVVIVLVATLIISGSEPGDGAGIRSPFRPRLVGALPSARYPRMGIASRAAAKADGAGEESDSGVTDHHLVGESGAGKSQLAAEYARGRAAAGWLIVWIDAFSAAGMSLELSTSAQSLDLTTR